MFSADDLRGNIKVGRAADQHTVFKSVGSALEDLAAAMAVYESRQ